MAELREDSRGVWRAQASMPSLNRPRTELMCYPRPHMSRLLSALLCLICCAPALAITGNAPPATGWAARPIVMVVDARGDLCTGTALTLDLVLTAAHCVVHNDRTEVKAYQTGAAIPVRSVALHPRFDLGAYNASRATADVALV